MSKYVERTCMICRKNKVWTTEANDGSGAGETGFGPNRPVCQSSECREIARERFASEQPPEEKGGMDWRKRDKVAKISAHMKTKQSLTQLYGVNWESVIRDLPEDIKQLCYQYEENINQREKAAKELNNKRESTNNPSNQEKEKCDDCGQIITGKSYYQHWDGTNGSGTSCESCNNNKKDNSKIPNTSTNNKGKPCDKCNLPIIGDKYSVGGKGYYCDSCSEELVKLPNNSSPNTPNGNEKKIDAKCQLCGIEIGVGTHCPSCFEKATGKKNSSNTKVKELNIAINWKFRDSNPEQDKQFKNCFKKIQEEINKGSGKLTPLPFGATEEQRIFLRAWQDAAITNKPIDIDKLDLPKDKKETLHWLLRELNADYNEPKPEQEAMPKLLLIGGPLLVLAIIGVVVIKRRRKKLTKKRS